MATRREAASPSMERTVRDQDLLTPPPRLRELMWLRSFLFYRASTPPPAEEGTRCCTLQSVTIIWTAAPARRGYGPVRQGGAKRRVRDSQICTRLTLFLLMPQSRGVP